MVQDRISEIVTPEAVDGVRLPILPLATLFGRIEFPIWLAARPDRRGRVAVVGRAGTTIVDDLCALDEFQCPPWDTDQVGGQITYEALIQSAGRRAIFRDRDAFPAFLAGVRPAVPAVTQSLARITDELDRSLTDRLTEEARLIFARVLRELDDLDHPMRSWLGDAVGTGAALAQAIEPQSEEVDPRAAADSAGDDLEVLRPLGPVSSPPKPPAFPGHESAEPGHRRSRALPTIAPDAASGVTRSQFEPDQGIVYYNDRHPDFPLVKDDESPLLDYLATLVAKEYVVYNRTRAASEEVGEEMVRMLVRVRRHLLRRRLRSRRANSIQRV
ncbi:MAG: hypothetical protein ACRENX_07980 [Candidatus Dormibacteria bacterium]